MRDEQLFWRLLKHNVHKKEKGFLHLLRFDFFPSLQAQVCKHKRPAVFEKLVVSCLKSKFKSKGFRLHYFVRIPSLKIEILKLGMPQNQLWAENEKHCSATLNRNYTFILLSEPLVEKYVSHFINADIKTLEYSLGTVLSYVLLPSRINIRARIISQKVKKIGCQYRGTCWQSQQSG